MKGKFPTRRTNLDRYGSRSASPEKNEGAKVRGPCIACCPALPRTQTNIRHTGKARERQIKASKRKTNHGPAPGARYQTWRTRGQRRARRNEQGAETHLMHFRSMEREPRRSPTLPSPLGTPLLAAPPLLWTSRCLISSSDRHSQPIPPTEDNPIAGHTLRAQLTGTRQRIWVGEHPETPGPGWPVLLEVVQGHGNKSWIGQETRCSDVILFLRRRCGR